MTRQRVVVAHTALPADVDPSTADLLDQVSLVATALERLETAFDVVAVTSGRIWEAAPRLAGSVVFNLLEAPPGAPHLHTAATAALELLDVPFTGNGAFPMWLTTDKLVTRSTLREHGLPVAPGGRLDLQRPDVLDRVPPPWILKPAWEDASVGLDGDPVAKTRDAALARGERLAAGFPGQPILVEHFLPGREFNVAVLEDGDLARVLPVAEMTYIDFPADVPHVLGYDAKWTEGTFAFENTRRRFVEDGEDEIVCGELRDLALAAWRACGLSGYARVDMRLDECGRPAILEVNSNPCLSEGAGFMAASGRAGLDASAVVRRLLAAAVDRWNRGRP